MPRTCTICFHKKRSAIDASLVAGEPIRAIACRFSVGRASLQRHQQDHLATYLSKAREFQETEGANNLVHRLREIHAETISILARAKKSKDWGTALRAIARLERQIELEAELLGKLERGNRGGDTHVVVTYVDRAIIASPGAPVPNAHQAIESGSTALRLGACAPTRA